MDTSHIIRGSVIWKHGGGLHLVTKAPKIENKRNVKMLSQITKEGSCFSFSRRRERF